MSSAAELLNSRCADPNYVTSAITKLVDVVEYLEQCNDDRQHRLRPATEKYLPDFVVGAIGS